MWGRMGPTASKLLRRTAASRQLRQSGHTASRSVMASAPDRPKGKSVSDLGMVWHFARHYPGHIAAAAVALLIAAAATSGAPFAFKLIIDKGFSGGGDIARWFQYLLMLVLIMALATAVRFYFVSWLGERVVA